MAFLESPLRSIADPVLFGSLIFTIYTLISRATKTSTSLSPTDSSLLSSSGKNSPQAPSKPLLAARAFLEAYASLSPDVITSHCTPSFTHAVLPSTLDMPTRDLAAFKQHASGICAVFESFRMVPVETFESAAPVGEGGPVAVWARMEGVMKGGMGEWRNQCVVMVWPDRAGEKVEKVVEFVDSLMATRMRENVKPEGF